ncbi:MAG: hypothetical protein SGI88_05800 [Candidatus Hydrogenedentes bacterium]|nr:hypothetical protein [Candidatus Hydrogenedentota bacterium]
MTVAQKNVVWHVTLLVSLLTVVPPAQGQAGFLPRFPASAPLPRAADTPGLPPLQLLGLSLHQAGGEVTADRPEFDSSVPLTMTAFWMPSIRLQASVPVDVTMWDHLNLISQTRGFRAGPEPGAEPWQVGSVYTQQYEIPLAPVASQFSGLSYLLVAPKSASNTASPLPPFQLLHTLLRPAIIERALPKEAMRAAFPSASGALAKHVRMGMGSDVTFETPEWPEHVRRIGIISSLSYRSVAQGEPVCRVLINEGGPDARTVHLLSGTMTARCDYDLFQRKDLNHERAPIFESRDSAQLDKDGRPTLLHTYFGVIDLGAPALRVRSLRFVCDSETILDLYGAVPLLE